ncbi:MAG TPA: long-chain fatty acid--CoA ligase [Chitinophagaceae bacterium]|nr:long-chain fatty acid--CoA ligase [Chitinophagaceae bacterium]
MTTPTRLFDFLDYQLEKYPQPDMLAAKEGTDWKLYSTAEVKTSVNTLSSGLLNLGVSCQDMSVERRDKIAIISNNRPEWIILDLACQQVGAVLVPIYPTINPIELEFILNDVAIKYAFVSDELLYRSTLEIKKNVPSLIDIFTFNPVPGARHYTEVIALGTDKDLTKIESIKSSILSEHLATILYTSGTTGNPKGVMLSHKNIVSNVSSSMKILPVDQKDKSLSFLPLNHIFERMITYLYINAGVSIYYAVNMETIAENLKEIKPNIFTTVPRLLEKVYERIMAAGLKLKGIKRLLFFRAIELGKQYEVDKEFSWWYSVQLNLMNRLVFSKWREALGGNLKCIVTGSAACQLRLLKIFTAGGIPILEGYGLTETSPVISVNQLNKNNRKLGTVGPILENVDVKIAEDGEIICKGPNIMLGYYRRPDLTGEAIKDGWFHTGDIGEIVDGKFLKITDRKKEIFKTSGGKYVAPQPIENKMKESPYIEQIMVLGANRKFPAALIIPSFQNLKEWAAKRNLHYSTNESYIHSSEVIDLIHSTINKYNSFFNHAEQIKKFELLPHEWTIQGGELTPTLKLKRKVIMEKYNKLVEKIYT